MSRVVVSPGQQRSAIRPEGHESAIGRAFNLLNFLSRDYFPNPQAIICACRGEEFAVRRESNGVATPPMSRELAHQLARRGFPQPDETIVPIGVSDQAAVGGDGDLGVTTQTRPEMLNLFTGDGIPHVNRPVVAPAGQRLAVGRESETRYVPSGDDQPA